MKTAFWLFGQYEATLLTAAQVMEATGFRSLQTLRNNVSLGRFPRPTANGRWHVEDVANWIDANRERAKNVPARDEAA